MNDVDIRLQCLGLANGDISHARRMYMWIYDIQVERDDMPTAQEIADAEASFRKQCAESEDRMAQRWATL